MREATIQRKPRPNRCIRSAGILFTRSAGQTDRHTHTHTQRQTENITPPRFRGGVINDQLNHSLIFADWQKTEAQKRRERLLLDELVAVVNKRDELVQDLDSQERA